MLGEVFDRFIEKSPISVMVRGTLERVPGPDPLDWWYERTAKKQYTRELLFSTVYDLMSQVVFRLQPLSMQPIGREKRRSAHRWCRSTTNSKRSSPTPRQDWSAIAPISWRL